MSWLARVTTRKHTDTFSFSDTYAYTLESSNTCSVHIISLWIQDQGKYAVLLMCVAIPTFWQCNGLEKIAYKKSPGVCSCFWFYVGHIRSSPSCLFPKHLWHLPPLLHYNILTFIEKIEFSVTKMNHIFSIVVKQKIQFEHVRRMYQTGGLEKDKYISSLLVLVNICI